MSDALVDNGDGTFTIPDALGGDWHIYDTGEGWTSSHHEDGWVGDPRWATSEQAAAAILGDPSPTLMHGGGTYAEWADRNGVA